MNTSVPMYEICLSRFHTSRFGIATKATARFFKSILFGQTEFHLTEVLDPLRTSRLQRAGPFRLMDLFIDDHGDFNLLLRRQRKGFPVFQTEGLVDFIGRMMSGGKH